MKSLQKYTEKCFENCSWKNQSEVLIITRRIVVNEKRFENCNWKISVLSPDNHTSNSS